MRPIVLLGSLISLSYVPRRSIGCTLGFRDNPIEHHSNLPRSVHATRSIGPPARDPRLAGPGPCAMSAVVAVTIAAWSDATRVVAEVPMPRTDVEAALRRAESLGGIRVMGPATSPNGLVVGHFTDPEGTLIGVAGVG